MVAKALEVDVLAAGSEESYAKAGILDAVDLSVVLIGAKAGGDPAECDTGRGPWMHHGPQMCVVDRYHLCAQHPGMTLNATAPDAKWVDYTMCMFNNQNYLKCSPQIADNCGTDPAAANFTAALGAVHGFCAARTGLDAAAVEKCAASPEATQMQVDSFARAAPYHPGTIIVGGYSVPGLEDMSWRGEANTTAIGAAVLQSICAAVDGDKPAGCSYTPRPKPPPPAVAP